MKEIKHFLLPKHTNELYKNEAVSSISLTKEVADKINELVDAYNKLNKTNLEWKQTIEGTVRKGVVYMKDNIINSIHDLFDILSKSDEFKTLYGDAIAELNEKLKCIGVCFTPETYGATGNGVVDDTDALLKMFKKAYAKTPTKVFENEKEKVNDYTPITFIFSGVYKISNPLVFKDTYGLSLDGLNLIASPSFSGDTMLKFDHITRNLKLSNITINGNHTVKTCVAIHDYTLTVDVVNAEITGFKEYGIYADGKGHEIKGVNIKINQFEYGNKHLCDYYVDGTGLYLGSERYDNHFTNLVVNYCAKAGVVVEGDTNFFTNSHFYSCGIMNKGRYNSFTHCYFDNAVFETNGFFTVDNNTFLKSGNDSSHFILINVDDANNWMLDTSSLNFNTFKSEKHVYDAVSYPNMESDPRFNTIGNTFYYVTPFTFHPRSGHTKNPWDESKEVFDDGTTGYRKYSDLVILYGETSENGFIYFPNNIKISKILHFGFERLDNANPNLIPWINTIKEDRVYLNSVGTGSSIKWVIIGLLK